MSCKTAKINAIKILIWHFDLKTFIYSSQGRAMHPYGGK